jgi:hypothetical protein
VAVQRAKDNGTGDVQARLSVDSGSRSLAVKNLVAEAWRPELAKDIRFNENGTIAKGNGDWRIGHRDGNKWNNVADNLIRVPASKKVAKRLGI